MKRDRAFLISALLPACSCIASDYPQSILPQPIDSAMLTLIWPPFL